MKPADDYPRSMMLNRSSPILALLLLAASAQAQEPVYADPQSARSHPDFAVQGEYASEKETGAGGPAMQVIARGDGEFSVVVYDGGLPGAGWRGEPPRQLETDAETVGELIESMALRRIDRVSPTLGASPPPDAVVLFDGSPESLRAHWQEGARRTEDGLLIAGATSKDTFTDYTLHLEFRTPFQPTASGQGRGNSGVYHQGRYETQILDSFGLEGRHNEAGGIYTVRDPDLNMAFPPLAWQTYDVDFTAARFDQAGNKISDARITARLNGVVVQPDVAVPHATTAAPLAEGPEPGPIYLQDHGNPVRFRNIWVVPRDPLRDARRPRVPGFERLFAAPGADAAAGGHVLISNLGCTNCHASDAVVWQSARGPVLTDVAARVRPDHLVHWIADPHAMKPGTTMPDLFAGLSEEQRATSARAIASYLSLAATTAKMVDRAGDSQAVKRGEETFHAIGCTACHQPQNGTPAPNATSVPLGALDQKYTLDSLAAFLADPHTTRPSGRMPRVVASADEARDVATYLLRDVVLVPGGQQFRRTHYRGRWDTLPDFESLTPAGEPQLVAELEFDGVGPLDGFAAVYEAFLPVTAAGDYTFTLGSDDGSRLLVDGREIVRVDGLHPYATKAGEIYLDDSVHTLRVEYFESSGEEKLTLEVEGPGLGKASAATLVTQDPSGHIHRELVASTFVADANLVDQGERLFRSIGCANCHTVEAGSSLVAPTQAARPLADLRPAEGCLAEDVPEGLPDYELSSVARRAISAALAEGTAEPDPAATIHRTMAAANCYACHSRDGVGGPELARETLFRTTTPEMGNEGRIPPPLDGVGDKLNDAYVVTLLAQGADERPYMMTRMPAFSYESLRGFHEAIVAEDRSNDAELPRVEAPVHRQKADGRLLVGNDGLACIKCHTFAGEGLAGIQAIDMLRMTTRLREDWFHRYLKDPTTYRPGTRMPGSFPDGRSVLTSVSDGDPALQIDAMWQYLSDGESAKPPIGLMPEALELIPKERPILYRNFLAGLNPRGIAVGYPERVNLAWDADSMSLARVWQNSFLDASLHWRGRGPGRLGPLGDAVMQIEAAAPVAAIDGIDAPWPAATTAEQGYRFIGYRLDADGRPTFRYRIGDCEIEDFAAPVVHDEMPTTLRRTIRLISPTAGMVLRAAVGEIEERDGAFIVNGTYRLRIEGVDARIYQVGDQQEIRALIPADGAVTVVESIEW